MIPALYVGEISQSIKGRSREHWTDYVGAREDNHMVQHQLNHLFARSFGMSGHHIQRTCNALASSRIYLKYIIFCIQSATIKKIKMMMSQLSLLFT